MSLPNYTISGSSMVVSRGTRAARRIACCLPLAASVDIDFSLIEVRRARLHAADARAYLSDCEDAANPIPLLCFPPACVFFSVFTLLRWLCAMIFKKIGLASSTDEVMPSRRRHTVSSSAKSSSLLQGRGSQTYALDSEIIQVNT